MTKFLVSLVIFSGISIAQTQVIESIGPPPSPYQRVLGYSGTNLIYTCLSPSFEPTGRRQTTKVAISAISKANPAVVTSTGHGFNTNGRPSVTISGATGTGWTAVNATFSVTVIDANTFSLYSAAGVALDSSGFGTLGGTVVFTTTAPRTTVAEWSVMKLTYDGSSNLIWVGWLNGTSAANSKCSDATSSTMQQQ